MKRLVGRTNRIIDLQQLIAYLELATEGSRSRPREIANPNTSLLIGLVWVVHGLKDDAHRLLERQANEPGAAGSAWFFVHSVGSDAAARIGGCSALFGQSWGDRGVATGLPCVVGGRGHAPQRHRR